MQIIKYGILSKGEFYFYSFFGTTFQVYHQYEDIFINAYFINDQKTILALTLFLPRDPFFFLSLSQSFFFLSASDSPEIHHLSLVIFFSSSLPPIHQRSIITLSFHRFSAVHTVDSYFCTRFPTGMHLISPFFFVCVD